MLSLYPHTFCQVQVTKGKIADELHCCQERQVSKTFTEIDLEAIKTFFLFGITAIAEIVGCYLPYLWLRQGKSVWLLIPAACSLALFAWLLSLHPAAAGHVYAAYGGVYVGVAILWLWSVDGIRPTTWDVVGSLVALLGMAIIMFAPRSA